MSKLVGFLATIAALFFLSLWTPVDAAPRKLDGIQNLDQVDLSARRRRYRRYHRGYYRSYYGPPAYYSGGYPYGYAPAPYYGYYRPYYYRPGPSFSFEFGF